jgi:hypothetical protein
MLSTIDNCIMVYGWIMLKLKDFEGIYVPAFQRQSHFWVSRGRLPLDNEAGPERTSLL